MTSGSARSRGLFLAAALVAAAAEFLAVGAMASEVMPTRGRAASLAAAFFGAAFMLRALGDSARTVHWLVYVSPLGWVEELHPLGGSQPLWLLPIAGLAAGCGLLTVFLAGRRDLGTSLLSDQDTAAPRLAMLGSPLLLTVRLWRASIASWLAGPRSPVCSTARWRSRPARRSRTQARCAGSPAA